MQNCEQLASIVLVQHVNPGNPMFYGSSTCTMDMRWGSSAVGTPETALVHGGDGGDGALLQHAVVDRRLLGRLEGL